MSALRNEYDRLASRETEAGVTLAVGKASLETARAKDVSATAKAVREGRKTPTHSHKAHADDVIAGTQLLLAGLEQALSEVQGELGREIEQSYGHKIDINTLRIPPLDDRLSGKEYVAYVTGFFERAQERHRDGLARIEQKLKYDASMAAREEAKSLHKMRGEPEHTFLAADYLTEEQLEGLVVPGGFGRLVVERAYNLPTDSPDRWKAQAEANAALRQAEAIAAPKKETANV